MKVSELLIPTLREAPADAEVVSHRLMLRAGLIRRTAAGIYSWLPLGLRVLRKVEAIVREEMDAAGAQELLMPGMQPAELWQESKRWEEYGPELLRLKDRHQRDFCLGPTHEEVITDLIRNEIRSYKQLPANFYQIQTKFRDEIRPRFGVMRAREFLMKDAYSFHLDDASLQETYERMHATYTRIFERCGLDFRAVDADSGAIGGRVSHEFHVLAGSGEDAIAFSDQGDYAANVELIPAPPPEQPRPPAGRPLESVATPDQHTIEAVSRFLGVEPRQCVKTLMVEAEGGGLCALILRGDHELNAAKAARLAGAATPLRFAAEQAVRERIGCPVGSLGPVGLDVPAVADQAAAALADFVCGANQEGRHLTGVNWGRDLPEPEVADLRNITEGEPSPDGKGRLSIARGIEVAHIFQLGRKYSAAMKATCLDETGAAATLTMGCYGIGISRVVAAAIEQNHDQRGIIWPEALAPFRIGLVPINMHRSERLRAVTEALEEELCREGFEVLVDDRKERPGVMFADLELIGLPHRIVISDRGLDAGTLEYKHRRGADSEAIERSRLIGFLRERSLSV